MKAEEKEAILQYSNLQARLEALLKEREEIIEKIEEMENTISSLEELKENFDSLFSIGSGVYCKGRLSEEKFLVSVGANVLLELDKKGTKEILTKRIEALKNAIKEIEEEIARIVAQQKKLVEIINRVSK